MYRDVWWSWSVFCMIFSREKLNRVSESKHHWRTPIVVLRNSPSWLFKRTALLEFSCSSSMAWTGPSSMLTLLRTRHRPASQTLSNIFLKSKNLWNRSCWCCSCFFMMPRLSKICSTVLRLGLKLALLCWCWTEALKHCGVRMKFIWMWTYPLGACQVSKLDNLLGGGSVGNGESMSLWEH